MKTVGVRELKNRLSEYIRQVRSGESVMVTDRGQVVAELTPPGQGATDASVPAGLALARRNLSGARSPCNRDVYPALRRAGRRKRTAAQFTNNTRHFNRVEGLKFANWA